MSIAMLVHNILFRYWDQQFPVDVDRIAKELGVKVVYVKSIGSNGEDISGSFEYNDNGDPICYIRVGDVRERQRFTLAHELGHYVLNHGAAFRDNNAVFDGQSNYDLREVEANAFAAELLMPQDAIYQAVANIPGITVGNLANTFEVSIPAMNYRLKNLGLK